MSTIQVGNAGETAAAEFLERKGYAIIERNFRTRYGELDIIAKDGECTVFVEVKTRRNAVFSGAADAVNKSKRRKLRTTASIWLSQRNTDAPARFDVIEVYINGDINHIPDAF